MARKAASETPPTKGLAAEAQAVQGDAGFVVSNAENFSMPVSKRPFINSVCQDLAKC